jgi:hypothetical protein
MQQKVKASHCILQQSVKTFAAINGGKSIFFAAAQCSQKSN